MGKYQIFDWLSSFQSWIPSEHVFRSYFVLTLAFVKNYFCHCGEGNHQSCYKRWYKHRGCEQGLWSQEGVGSIPSSTVAGCMTQGKLFISLTLSFFV